MKTTLHILYIIKIRLNIRRHIKGIYNVHRTSRSEKLQVGTLRIKIFLIYIIFVNIAQF